MLRELAKATIDERSVEDSPYSWREMAYKQARVPAMLAALVIVLPLVADVPWYELAFAALFVAYATLPALGACYYWEEAEKR